MGKSCRSQPTPQAFIKACENALLTTPEEHKRNRCQDEGNGIGNLMEHDSGKNARTDATHNAQKEESMKHCTRQNRRTHALLRASSSSAGNFDGKQKCVIIGAGPTGLSAAYHLDEDTLLLDKNPTVGGWCRSIEDKGFTFDHAGHIMFSNDAYVQKLYKILLGNNVHWQNREAWVYSKGVHTRYPFQGAFMACRPTVIKECIVGAMERAMAL